jgi:hypothetical protein
MRKIKNSKEVRELEKFNQVTLDYLVEAITSTRAKINAKDIVKLENTGYAVVFGGDLTFSRFNNIIVDKVPEIECNQFDTEMWYLKRKEYTITQDDTNTMTNMCKTNG